ncbi:hypothetical protein SOQ14_12025 [Erythrobacter sp. T5W1-R]|uniref:hypothetical protein n=1 Tax=Erythrobacter sp. T5W1-R TaxID=3101752 RepID=UPI002AFF1863|nr:hypothetical protein [Erythrobacter sp. T5W1-R]MEA1619645.1 hypothetical protein [Erythrobacter sp. T5W1-R]
MAIRKSVAALDILKRAEAANPQGWATELVNGGRKATALLESLETVAAKRNPTETPEAHALRVHKAAQKVLQQVEELTAKANETRTAAGRSISEQIQARTKLTDGRRGAEIRTLFRQLPAQDRQRLMEVAMQNRDDETLAALFDAPTYLSGMDADYQSRMKLHYETLICPELHEQLEAVLDADNSMSVIRRVVREAASEALNPSYVSRIVKEQAEAEQAQAGFEGAIASNL